MKEYEALVGGRFTYKQDWRHIQDLALSISQIFTDCDSFIVSGCEITGAIGNRSIAPGYIWMNKKIRYFEGKANINLADPNYLVEDTVAIPIKYSGGGTKVGGYDHRVIWSDITPGAGTEFIPVPVDGALPTLNDKFFGKYAILSNTSSSQQTIAKLLVLQDSLSVKGAVNIGNGAIGKDLSVHRTDSSGKVSKIVNSISTDGVGAIQAHYDNKKIGEMAFNPTAKEYTLKINDVSQISVTESAIVLKSLTSEGVIKNADISISGNSINKTSGDNDTSDLRLNYSGYNGGVTRFRDTSLYDGKNGLIAKFSGSTKTFTHYGTVVQASSDQIGVKIQEKTKIKTDASLLKSIDWYDKDDAVMFRFGYISNSDQNITLDNSGVGDIVIAPKQYLKSTTPIMEQGELLSNRYASKTDLPTSLDTKVDKVAGYSLTKNDFTDTLKAKLDDFNYGAVGIGNPGLVTGGQVSNEIRKRLVIAENLNDIPDKTTARNNLDVPRKGDSYLKSQTYSKGETYSRSEADTKFQTALVDTGWIDAGNPGTTSEMHVKVRQIGNIVNITGVSGSNTFGTTLFSIPDAIAPPPFTTGLKLGSPISGSELTLVCIANGRNFQVMQAGSSLAIQYINITYFV